MDSYDCTKCDQRLEIKLAQFEVFDGQGAVGPRSVPTASCEVCGLHHMFLGADSPLVIPFNLVGGKHHDSHSRAA